MPLFQNGLVDQGSCRPEAELFLSNGFRHLRLAHLTLFAPFPKWYGEMLIPISVFSLRGVGGLETLGLPQPLKVFWLWAS